MYTTHHYIYNVHVHVHGVPVYTSAHTTHKDRVETRYTHVHVYSIHTCTCVSLYTLAAVVGWTHM